MTMTNKAGASLCLVLGLCLAVSACGDGSGGGPTDIGGPEIRIVDSAVQAGAFMNVRTRGLSLSADRYDASLGGAPVTFARMDDSTLVALLPDIPAGSHTLEAVIGGHSFSESVSVAAAEAISDPRGRIEQTLEEAIASFPAEPPEGIAPEAWDAQRDSLLVAVAEVQTALAGMSADEQLATARFIIALQDAFGPLLTEESAAGMQSYVQASTFRCTQAAGAAFISGTAWFAGIGALVAGVFVPGVNIVAAPAGIIVVLMAHKPMIKDVQKMMEICYKQRGVNLGGSSSGPVGSGFALSSLSGFNPRGEGLAGVMEAPVVAGSSLSARMVFVRDIPVSALPTQDIQAFSTSHIDGNSQFSRISSLLEKAYALVDELPDRLKRRLPTMPRLVTAGEKPVETTSIGPDSVRIEKVTGGVSLTRAVDGQALVLTADAPGDDEREFTFDLVSTTDATVRKTIPGLLVAEGVTLIPLQEIWYATTTINEANQTWTMSCRMEWQVVVAGEHPVHLSSMTWNNYTNGDFPSYPGSEQYPANSYAPGTYTLYGNWWRTWVIGENSADFWVEMNMGYTNNVTGRSGTSNNVEMECRLPIQG